MTASGTPAERAVGRRAVRLVGHPEEGVQVVGGRALAVELEQLARRRRSPARTCSAAWAARQVRELAHAPGLGTRKPLVGRVGRLLERRSRGQLGARLVGAQHVLELDHVRGRLDAVEVELADLLDVVEDRRQLAGHPLDLVVGQASRARRATWSTCSRSIMAGRF